MAVPSYYAYVVQENFLNGAPWQLSETMQNVAPRQSNKTLQDALELTDDDIRGLTAELRFLYKNREKLHQHNNTACVHAYADPLQTQWGNLLAVAASYF